MACLPGLLPLPLLFMAGSSLTALIPELTSVIMRALRRMDLQDDGFTMGRSRPQTLLEISRWDLKTAFEPIRSR
jgi:hypothetical protein